MLGKFSISMTPRHQIVTSFSIRPPPHAHKMVATAPGTISSPNHVRKAERRVTLNCSPCVPPTFDQGGKFLPETSQRSSVGTTAVAKEV